ncbi:MAG: hypothetical protein ACJAU6_002330 [Alphaproteobacteria bacterium]|jgi:hypothetical protein
MKNLRHSKFVKTALVGALASAALLLHTPAIHAMEKPAVTAAPAPITMMFLGNSYIYYNNSLHNHLRKLTKSLIPKKKKKFFFKSMTISGSYLSDHAMSAEGMISRYTHKKKKGPWELVVLQGQSREPINPKKSEKFKSAAKSLDAMIQKAGAKTVLFMTWAYKAKPEMAGPLRDAYTKLGNELKALVVPTGVAFERARTENPTMELYAKDGKHPSVLGTYLVANVFFSALYGQSPVGAKYTAGLTPEEALFAQNTAWQAVSEYYGR